MHREEIPFTLPGDEGKIELEIISRAVREARGTVLLAGCSARAAAAALASAEGQALVASTPDAEDLRELRGGILDAGVPDTPLFFHGGLAEVRRDLALAPALVILGGRRRSVSFEDALELAALVPAGAEVLCWCRGNRASVLSLSGRFEAVPEDSTEKAGYSHLRATSRCTAFPRDFHPEALEAVKRNLDAKYFALGELSTSGYTPVAGETEPARAAVLPELRKRPPGWPFRTLDTSPWPDTLPSGRPWPRISVVTPSFNQGRFLEENILSVLRQDYSNVEHIIMDGGSIDSTQSVLDRYRGRLAQAVSEPDRGQAHAINKGMALATGEILTWLNSDDMLAPGALYSIALAFDASGADMVAGVCEIVKDGTRVSRHLASCEDGPLPLNELLDLDGSWNAGRFFYQPEVFFTRDIWRQAGGRVSEELHYSMDYELWLRCALEGARLHVIGSPAALFREHADQKTADEDAFHAELIRCRQKFLDNHQLTAPEPRPAASRHRLRVSMVNDFGYDYGAGIAHQRIAESFLMAGHDVQVVALKHDEFGLKTPPHNLERVLETVERHHPHVIVAGNLHRTGTDPLLLNKLAALAPTFSVLHDFWLLTGRCAYTAGCDKHLSGCDETCPTPDEYPQLHPSKIAAAFERKRRALGLEQRPHLLACSEWTESFARRTLEAGHLDAVSLQRVQLGIPAGVFRQVEPGTARRMLKLPEDRFIVLLSGSVSDPRKGLRDVIDAIRQLDLPGLLVAIAGAAGLDEDFGLDPVVYLGYLDSPEKLALAYAAADLFVGASREETFGQAFVEAAACGTPAIGIAAAAVPEAITPGVTGTLVRERSPQALAAAILDYYLNPERCAAIGRWGAAHVRNEWALERSLLSFLRVFRRLGITETAGLRAKLTFRPERPEAPVPLNPFADESQGVAVHDLSDEENPIPKYGVGPYRWAFGPATRIAYRSRREGPHTLFLKYRNPHPEQRIKVTCDGREVFSGSLPCSGYEEARLLIADVVLRAGKNEIRLEFTRWNRDGVDPRPLAIMVEQFHLAPANRPAESE